MSGDSRVFSRTQSYPWASWKLYSTALFVCKKWLLREVGHRSPLRTTVSETKTRTKKLNGTIPNISNTLIKKTGHHFLESQAYFKYCDSPGPRHDGVYPAAVDAACSNKYDGAFSRQGAGEADGAQWEGTLTDCGSHQWSAGRGWRLPAKLAWLGMARKWRLVTSVLCHQWELQTGGGRALAAAWKRGEGKGGSEASWSLRLWGILKPEASEKHQESPIKITFLVQFDLMQIFGGLKHMWFKLG